MQTHFTPEQLSDPHIADSNSVLRKCVVMSLIAREAAFI
jgi:hypothetical protein